MEIAQRVERPTVVKRVRVLMAVLSIVLCGLIVWWGGLQFLQQTDIAWLRVEKVNILCQWPLQVSQVKSWLPALEGKNILFVRASEILEVLKTKPWIKEITIRKEYPNKIHISVETRTAKAVYIFGEQAFFLDSQGAIIEKVSSPLLKSLDLPVISRETDSNWKVEKILPIIEGLPVDLMQMSELVLGVYPYFKLLLSSPSVEVLMTDDQWSDQLQRLGLLLTNPSSQIGQPKRINLVFPKKAIVSPAISK